MSIRKIGAVCLCASLFLIFAISSASASKLPVADIQNAIGAQGILIGGVLEIPILRTDVGNVTEPQGGITLTPDFEIHGHVWFQPLTGGNAFMNGDLPLVQSETDRFVSVLLRNGLTCQALRQHLPTHPQIWFVHFGGKGDPVKLATALKGALDETTTPFPQTLPSNPTSPLDADKLATALHGTATIGANGVVSVTILRKKTVAITGVDVKPTAGVSTVVEFNPIGGTNADVVVNFSMAAAEVTKVSDLMRNTLKWHEGSLASQEIREKPQLYFSHMLKEGDAYQLAAEIRQGLDLTASE